MSLLQRIFGEKKQKAPLLPLYNAIVAYGRDLAWYVEGEVPDTVDGRFDLIAAVVALVLLRLEQEEGARPQTTYLTELFIDDMEQSFRQIGIGDYVVGKHVGRAMSALGGRLTAFREAAAGGLEAPVRRNIFHETPPSEQAVHFVAGRLEAFRGELQRLELEALLEGRIPTP